MHWTMMTERSSFKKDVTMGEERSRTSKWGLTKTMIVLIGVCCIISAAVNIVHVHSNDNRATLHENTAIHQAMKEFKQGRLKGPKEKKPVAKVVNVKQGISLEQGKLQHGASSLAGLSCERFGGPSQQHAQEMVYWSDIPSDTKYVSPFHVKHGQQRRYMTFEPDGGGWNNIRMAMETVLGLAIAMGRTLVLPPEQRMYLLAKNRGKEKTDFSFQHFFPMKELAEENDGLEIITMKEFLEAEAMTGHLRDKYTGQISFPPDNRTDWDGQDVKILKEWMRNVTHTPLWSPGRCMAAFPASGDHKDVEALKAMAIQIHKDGKLNQKFLENPTPVDATPIERMRENLSDRLELCVYDEKMQNETVVHFMCYHKMRVRMLVHFYAFLFFEDWREDLWMKRFMRDHVRYIDEVQCAAARVVHAIREYARSRDPQGNPNGLFDAFHVRRGDFQFKQTRIEAKEIYKNTKDYLTPNATIFIATDERNKAFFDDMKKYYDIKFLDDFRPHLQGVNTNFFGMIDQLVASRGRNFFGCWHSTFTGFINRIRGYHSVKNKSPGYEKGLLPDSYYYVPNNMKEVMLQYAPLQGAFFNREFPTSWRDIDKGIGSLQEVLQG